MNRATEKAAWFVARARPVFTDDVGYVYDRWDKMKADPSRRVTRRLLRF
ncbi:MAG: hypothetical protein K0R39_3663 [Symbiobacteriaceae bacterium]|jgi:hypothetical protein|nr:hypothetical protein [Symbiobacteriaceae bacterium]